jgi:hypothetical protein
MTNLICIYCLPSRVSLNVDLDLYSHFGVLQFLFLLFSNHGHSLYILEPSEVHQWQLLFLLLPPSFSSLSFYLLTFIFIIIIIIIPRQALTDLLSTLFFFFAFLYIIYFARNSFPDPFWSVAHSFNLNWAESWNMHCVCLKCLEILFSHRLIGW